MFLGGGGGGGVERNMKKFPIANLIYESSLSLLLWTMHKIGPRLVGLTVYANNANWQSGMWLLVLNLSKFKQLVLPKLCYL